MKITPKFQFVSGSFDTDTAEMVCVKSTKYGEVSLCIKSNMNIEFASIKLYDGNRAVDADATFQDACKLGDEITNRWNSRRKEGKSKLIVSYPDFDLVSSISFACLKNSDSGEQSPNKQARKIIDQLEKDGYVITKKQKVK